MKEEELGMGRYFVLGAQELVRAFSTKIIRRKEKNKTSEDEVAALKRPACRYLLDAALRIV